MVDTIRMVMDVEESSETGQLYNRELCVVVALNMVNAFNKIKESLQNKTVPQYFVGVVQSYLSDRAIQCEGRFWPIT